MSTLSDYEKAVEICDRYASQKDTIGPLTITQLVKDLQRFDPTFPQVDLMKFSKGVSGLQKRGYTVLRRRNSKKRWIIISKDAAQAHLALRFLNAV